MPCSLARVPYDTVMAGSMRAVAVERGGLAPFSPIYQETVSAGVPATSAVAVLNGGPATRCGGLAKKSVPAAIAEAADSAVCANVSTAVVSAACRFTAVAFAVGPMVN